MVNSTIGLEFCQGYLRRSSYSTVVFCSEFLTQEPRGKQGRGGLIPGVRHLWNHLLVRITLVLRTEAWKGRVPRDEGRGVRIAHKILGRRRKLSAILGVEEYRVPTTS